MGLSQPSLFTQSKTIIKVIFSNKTRISRNCLEMSLMRKLYKRNEYLEKQKQTTSQMTKLGTLLKFES